MTTRRGFERLFRPAGAEPSVASETPIVSPAQTSPLNAPSTLLVVFSDAMGGALYLLTGFIAWPHPEYRLAAWVFLGAGFLAMLAALLFIVRTPASCAWAGRLIDSDQNNVTDQNRMGRA